MNKNFFPPKPDISPKIYVYKLVGVESHRGLLKIGGTHRNVTDRIREQLGTANIDHRIELIESAIKNDGSTFSDHDVHRVLEKKGCKRVENREWFQCTTDDIKSAILELKTGRQFETGRDQTFKMRPEQEDAVQKTMLYFQSSLKENPKKTPHFLWNAKMRFGKTFAAYKLAQKMAWKKILVLTFKPAAQSAWEKDLKTHVDFNDWQFLAQDSLLSIENIDKDKPLVLFGSFQDFLGKNKSTGGIKTKNEWVHTTNWDCVIFDEYHFGAWNDNSKSLFNENEEDKKIIQEDQAIQKEEGYEKTVFEEDILPITTYHFLYLSGTPFRALANGEFIEEQIFNWTYSDEQKAKENWSGDRNPYLALPRMVMLTYQLPVSIRHIALQGEYDGFDLNEFFKAEREEKTKEKEAKFSYQSYVQKWLNFIRGALETNVDALKAGVKKPPFPFSDTRLLGQLNHTLWFLPTVAACNAMANLLDQRQNIFFHDYKIIVAAGSKAGIGVNALAPVEKAMDCPLESKTITLSCGKLTTGVSVKPWTGIFMLRNLSSPETYFQAAFRVQTPWVVKNPDGTSPHREDIIKKECYLFDFAPDRALRQISDYSCRLNVAGKNPKDNVHAFVNFLPVLYYDGAKMKNIDPSEILDIAMSGTSSTLLAKRWESALLVNVDDETLKRLMSSEAAMKALLDIEGFRSLNQDIESVINKSDSLKKLKKERNDQNDQESDSEQKKDLSDKDKKIKSMRKKIQEKLIKLATRMPVFMYLTDYREQTLKDVIIKIEPWLFKKVTGLKIEDFELLISLNVFNGPLMEDAVYKFKRYEDTSLTYTGINKHIGEKVGGFDTVINADFGQVFEGG